MYTAFFLGANSKHGFHSLYDSLIDLKHANAVYILKGSPGSGKSTFMRRVMSAVSGRGEPVEQIYCSSDPDSLDAVVFPSHKAAIVDGTAPHIIEPTYPFAVERYIDLGAFADYTALREKRDDIIAVKERYGKYFGHVYRLCSCAGQLDNELFDIALGGVSIPRIRRKAHGIISRELSGTGSGRNTQPRFLSAISPKGYISLLRNSESTMSRVFVIEDSFGLAPLLLSPILDAAERANFPCFACYNPLHPEKLEHLIIPELSLAFISSCRAMPYNGEYYRKIRLDAMIDPECLRAKKQKTGFTRKLSGALLSEACALLAEAKNVHDELEALYNPHIDFDALGKRADTVAEEILSL